MVRASRIAGRWTDTAVFLADQFIIRKCFVAGISPELASHAPVQMLGEGLGEAIGERLEQDRIVIVVLRFELCQPLVDTDSGGYRKSADVILDRAVVRCDEVSEAPVDAVIPFDQLLPRIVASHPYRCTRSIRVNLDFIRVDR